MFLVIEHFIPQQKICVPQWGHVCHTQLKYDFVHKKWGYVLVMGMVLDSIGPSSDHAWRQI